MSTPDTRHPQYDDATLQAAIDAACQETTIPNGYQSLDLRTGYSGWGEESPARLALARAFLARLPEPTPQLSRLRPIAEAGPVPKGAVRVTGFYANDSNGSGYVLTEWASPRDTHFADILPPEASQPAVEAERAEKPEPSIREVLDAIPVYLPTQHWQPAVGEPVRLVSGGWPMVVGKVDADIDRITTVWMDAQGQPQQASYAAACLVSAKEDQP